MTKLVTTDQPDVVRHHFSGTYGFRLEGWLRATDNESGEFLQSSRPRIEHPVVMAGFQSPPPPKKVDVAQPLPPQTINSGYYPYAFAGVIRYESDGTLSGRLQLSIGGNANGQDRPFEGTYRLNPATGIDGTFTFQADGKSSAFYFVLVKNDEEIEFMDISSRDATGGPRSVTATGTQKRI
jgi:hypothetical protein